MENKDRILREQEAPLKNGDRAFVKVTKENKPVDRKSTVKKEPASGTATDRDRKP